MKGSRQYLHRPHPGKEAKKVQVEELRDDFQAAIDHYIADCAATGRKPLKAASGKMMLRVSPEIHAKALAMAKTSGKSLNQWAEEVLGKAAHV